MPTFAAEQILFANHVTGGAYLLSAIDGSVLETIAGPITGFPSDLWNTASPTVLAGHGNVNGLDPNGDAIALFDYSFNQIAYVQWGAFTGHTFPVGVDAAGNFYFANDQRLQAPPRGHTDPPLVVVRRYSALGVQTGEWTLPYVTISGMAVSRDGSTLYYGEDSTSLEGTYPDLSPLHRYDLVNDLPLSDLIAGGGSTKWGIDWFISVDDELFATWAPAVFPDPAAEDWIVRRIDIASGAILSTYAAPNPPFDGFDLSIRPDLADDSSFWMWTEHFSGGDPVTFTKCSIATGETLRQFTVDGSTLQGGTTWWVQSTPEVVVEPDVPGTIVVEKSAPDDPEKLFTFFAGEPLVPAAFALTDGQSQTFADLDPGDGYSIAELVPPGWSAEIVVSNGSPPDNISVAEGELVTVSVLNTKTPCECCVATKIALINQALLKLGHSQTIESLTDSTREAFTGNLLFDDTLKELLRAYPWAFATKYADSDDNIAGYMDLVAGSTSDPAVQRSIDGSTEWQYAYRYPVDCLFARRIVPPEGRKFDRHPIPFRKGRDENGLLIYSNEPDAVLEYTALVECSENWADQLFEDALSWLVAAKMAPSLSRNGKTAQDCWAMHKDVLNQAGAVDAKEQQQEPDGPAQWLEDRE